VDLATFIALHERSPLRWGAFNSLIVRGNLLYAKGSREARCDLGPLLARSRPGPYQLHSSVD